MYFTGDAWKYFWDVDVLNGRQLIMRLPMLACLPVFDQHKFARILL